MITQLKELEEVISLIKKGERLILAGDEKILSELPPGEWIAGTIPYFMDVKGGKFTTDQIFVTQFPSFIKDIRISVYNEDNIQRIYHEAYRNGFSIIIIPSSSDIHTSFAINSPKYSGFATKPLIGWISGVNLEELGTVTPKVYNGRNGKVHEHQAVVVHASLPDSKWAEIDIVNIFDQGGTDILTFPVDGFIAKDVYVNGKRKNFAEYIEQYNIDVKLPLVTNAYGININTSFQKVEGDLVHFYAPVFSNTPYKFAQPFHNYMLQFINEVPGGVGGKAFFSCNCILNYLYAELEGKKTFGFTGPVTFGEVAYQLLNQTMVYLTINDK